MWHRSVLIILPFKLYSSIIQLVPRRVNYQRRPTTGRTMNWTRRRNLRLRRRPHRSRRPSSWSPHRRRRRTSGRSARRQTSPRRRQLPSNCRCRQRLPRQPRRRRSKSRSRTRRRITCRRQDQLDRHLEGLSRRKPSLPIAYVITYS